MNKLDYAQFEYKQYEPSTFRNVLVNLANESYNAYTKGLIKNRQYGSEVLAGVEEVAKYFNDRCTIGQRMDVNYDTIIDDLMLYVDENNAKLASWALVK